MEHLYSHAKFGDHDYDKKEECEWTIETSEGQRVRLLFLSFEVEHEQDCSYDFVELFDGEDDTAPLLGRFCGNTVSRVRSTFVPADSTLCFATDHSCRRNSCLLGNPFYCASTLMTRSTTRASLSRIRLWKQMTMSR